MKTSKKVDGVFVGITGLRIKLWMEAVMEAAGVKEIAELVVFLDSVSYTHLTLPTTPYV